MATRLSKHIESIKEPTHYDFLTSKIAKRFYWNFINGIIAFALAWLTQLSGAGVEYAGFVLLVATPILNGITKELNNRLQKNK